MKPGSGAWGPRRCIQGGIAVDEHATSISPSEKWGFVISVFKHKDKNATTFLKSGLNS